MADSGQGGITQADREARRREKPPGGAIHSTVGPDRAPIRYGHWEPEGDRKGTCLILHGRRAFIEKYFETVRDLLDRGYAVFTFDWRGQGRSVRLLSNSHKGHIEHFDDYLADLDRFMRDIVRKERREPVMILGDSMGGHLALRYAHDHPRFVSRLLLVAPMISIHFAHMPLSILRGIVAVACRLRLSKRYAPFQTDFNEDCKQFEGNILTADPERFADEAYFVDRDPQLAMGGVTFGWLKAAFESINRLNAPGFAEEIPHPVFIAAAGQDSVVDNARARQFADRLPRGHFITIGDARHEILRETDPVRAMFWRLADEFLEATE